MEDNKLPERYPRHYAADILKLPEERWAQEVAKQVPPKFQSWVNHYLEDYKMKKAAREKHRPRRDTNRPKGP